MPLLFVRRFTDIEGGAFPRPVLDKIILLPVVEDVGECVCCTTFLKEEYFLEQLALNY